MTEYFEISEISPLISLIQKAPSDTQERSLCHRLPLRIHSTANCIFPFQIHRHLARTGTSPATTKSVSRHRTAAQRQQERGKEKHKAEQLALPPVRPSLGQILERDPDFGGARCSRYRVARPPLRLTARRCCNVNVTCSGRRCFAGRGAALLSLPFGPELMPAGVRRLPLPRAPEAPI